MRLWGLFARTALMIIAWPVMTFAQEVPTPSTEVDHLAVRSQWGQMSADQFIQSYNAAEAATSTWPAEQKLEYDSSVDAEAARRVEAGIPIEDAASAKVLYRWAATALSPQRLYEIHSTRTANWGQMTTAQFVQDVSNAAYAKKVWNDGQRTVYNAAVGAEAARRILSGDLGQSGSGSDVRLLISWAADEIPTEQLNQIIASTQSTWGQMSSGDFAKLVDGAQEVVDSWPAEQQDAFRGAASQEAARRVSAGLVEFGNAESSGIEMLRWAHSAMPADAFLAAIKQHITGPNALPYWTPEELYRLFTEGRDIIPAPQLAEIESTLAASTAFLESMSFRSLRWFCRHSIAENLATEPYENTKKHRELVANWVRVHGIEELDLGELVILFEDGLRHKIRRACIMDVEWVGQLQIPNAGEYVFDVTPLQISTSSGDASDTQEMKVFVNGVQVVSADPNNWTALRQAVALPAGQMAEVKVTLRNSASLGELRMAVGQLYWKGPGFSRQIVPENLWVAPNGSGPGVRCTVHWVETDATEHTEVVNVPNIDQVLLRETPNLNGEPYEQVKNAIYQKLMEDSAFLPPPPAEQEQLAADASVAPPTEPTEPPKRVSYYHPLASGNYRLQNFLPALSTPQRLALANKLLEHPGSFLDASLASIMRIHSRLQPGAESQSLDILGLWMQRHANRKVELTSNVKSFFDANRGPYRSACIAVAWQHPKSLEWLQSDYLVREDGDLALPASYVLGYGYLQQGRIREWIEFLDAKLADETVAGDIRVNWLIARAMAEEIRENPAERHISAPPELPVAFVWLEEALMSAQSPKTKDRVRRERIARFTALQNWSAARYELVGQPQLESFGSAIDRLERQAIKKVTDDAKAAQKAYLEELRQRASEAEASGDTAAQERYSGEIQALEGAK